MNQLSTHPLVALLECKATGLKSLLTHYIDATVDSQFASLRNSFETMIQSGVIGPNSDGTHFGTTLPQPTHTNTHQSSDECSHEYSNDTLTRAQQDENNLQNEVSLSNTINTESMIKQEFDEVDEEEIDEDSVAKCENCEKGIYTSGENAELGENGHESSDATQLNKHSSSENNQITQSIISNDISPSPSPTNPINTQSQIKQEYLQGSSITLIPMDFTNNAALNDTSIDEQIEGQNIQIQTDEFDHNYDLDDDDYDEGSEEEYLNNPNCEDCVNGVCDLDHENNNNHMNNDVSVGDSDETNFDEAQFDIDINVTNNTQMNIQIDGENTNTEKCVSELNMEQSTFSTSGVRSSTRKRIQTKVFGDLVQSNGNPLNSAKRKSDQANESVKKLKRKQFLDDDEDTDSDDQEDHAYNAIQEKSIATECTTNPIQANLAQSNRHLHCSHCHKSFDHKSKLERHLRVHTGERPFQCNLCDKRFNVKSNLTKHQLNHQNIKRFGCDHCGKKFTQKFNLENHLRIHSGERLFQCNFCQKSFTESGSRKRHEQAIHLHVKPYRCKQCAHTATQRSHIIRHIRVVHFGLPQTIKEQRELNIIDHRDPEELVEKV